MTGFLLSIRGFLDLGFAPLAGYLADCWGRHRVVAVAMPLACFAVVALALQPALPAVIGLVFLIFAAGTILHVTFDAIAGDIAPVGKRRAFFSLFVTWQDLGAATGPLLGYWLASQAGPVWLYLTSASLLLAAAAVYVATFMRRTRQPAPLSHQLRS